MTEMTTLAQYQGAKVLITGGLGFIGSNLALRLVELGAQVVIVDSLLPEYGGNLANLAGFEDRVRVNISDVRDGYSLRYLVKGQDFLFNLAGQTSHLDSMKDPFTDMEINCRAQLAILEACRECQPTVRLVFASTRQIYGIPDYLPVDERHPLRPVDVNGINKLAGEQYHLLYHKVYGLRAVVLRLTNTYGPRMRIKDARQTFLGVWVKAALEGVPFEVWGGEQLRDYTFVDDCVDALLRVGTQEAAWGQALNVGGERPYTLKETAELLIQANAGRGAYTVRPFPAERKKIDIGHYHADYGRLRTLVGWEPGVPLPEGLARTLEYFRARLPLYC